MTDSEKLSKVLSELKRVAFPDEQTHSEDYWMSVQCEIDNSTDAACDRDEFVKNLIKLIEEGE